jgi:hypothetical protein
MKNTIELKNYADASKIAEVLTANGYQVVIQCDGSIEGRMPCSIEYIHPQIDGANFIFPEEILSQEDIENWKAEECVDGCKIK